MDEVFWLAKITIIKNKLHSESDLGMIWNIKVWNIEDKLRACCERALVPLVIISPFSDTTIPVFQ